MAAARSFWFLGRLLYQRPNDEQTWSTDARGECRFPVVTVGKDIGGKWYALVHFRGRNSGAKAQFERSKNKAMAKVKDQLRMMAEDLANLDLKDGD